MAISAFVSGQLYARWKKEDSSLRRKYSDYCDCGEMMRCKLRELKTALKVLCEELAIQPLHKKSPKTWNQLNEFLKKYRDWFVHPTPEKVHCIFTDIEHRRWDLASNTAVGVIGHFYDELGAERPEWLTKGSLIIPLLKVTKI